MAEDRIDGQTGRKLSAKAKLHEERLERFGFEGLDTPGRRGRPKSVATMLATQRGVSSRTMRRRMAVMREIGEKFGITPAELAQTSLQNFAEQQALLKLHPRAATILIIAATRGKKVSAKVRLDRVIERFRTDEHRLIEQTNALIRIWKKTSPAAQDRFMKMLAESRRITKEERDKES